MCMNGHVLYTCGVCVDATPVGTWCLDVVSSKGSHCLFADEAPGGDVESSQRKIVKI